MHTCLNASKAFMASLVSDTNSDFLPAPSLVRYSLRGCAMLMNPLMNSFSGEPDQGKLIPQCRSVVGCILGLPSGLSGWGRSHSLRLDDLGRWFFPKNVHLDGFNFRLCSLNWSKMIVSSGGVPPPSVRRHLYCQVRWGSMLDSAPWGSSALTSGMWLVHCTAQRACSYT